jgi:hypothetical protein
MASKLRTAAAAVIAGTSVFAVLRWLRARRPEVGSERPARRDDIVEEADLESFPASDPPSWTLGED